MENSILNQLAFDPAYLILGLAGLTVLLLITVIVCILKIKKLYRSYDKFMRGKDAENLEEFIFTQIEEIKYLKAENRANRDSIRKLTKEEKKAYQKFGVSKYNAFSGMGGNLSFAIALLDFYNTGFVLNCMHAREGCYVYMKKVEKGETEVALGSEEKEALEQALGY